MVILRIACLVVMACSSINSQAFLYPVAKILDSDGIEKIYLVHQISLYQLELWLWDPATTRAHKALPASYTPAGLRLIPDGSGFSFIDNGLIKIKKHDQRTIKNLTFSDSIYHVGMIQWIDKNSGYCSAKKRERFGIYQITMQGDVYALASSIAYDCMYPSKTGSHLFYIERSESEPNCYHYEILQMPYPERVDALAPTHKLPSQSILDFDEQPLIFLDMISPYEGFVIGHQAHVDAEDQHLTFTYYHIQYVSTWLSTALFSFDVPSGLLMSKGNERLHESLLPLVPRPEGEHIFFVDSKGTQNLSLYVFNRATKLTVPLIQSSNQQATFPAFPFKDFYYYGGTLQNTSPGISDGPSFLCDERGLVHITLPSLLV